MRSDKCNARHPIRGRACLVSPPTYSCRHVAHSGDILIIGAGPAGLTAAYELARHGHTGTVIESDDVVGGIAHGRTRRISL